MYSLKTYELTSENIELSKLLKLLRIAHSGAQAKLMVEAGEVRRNGVVELRKRAKLKKGDKVEFAEFIITIN